MQTGKAIDPRVEWIRAVTDLDDAWRLTHAGAQHREVVRKAEHLGDSLRDGPRVRCVRTLPLTTLLYPTRYAYNGACRVPVAYVVMTHRALLVQVDTPHGLKQVLFNPTDHAAAREAPFFRRLEERAGKWLARHVLTRSFDSIELQLARLGVRPEDVDVIAFDHFHVQDLRPLLGGVAPGQPPVAARFPNALLLAPRSEWEAWDDLHPTQRAWYIPEGKRGVPRERVVLTDADVQLGDGCLLLRTPGHTSGNQTLFCHGERGVFGCSENGVGVDSWAPRASSIPGLAAVARMQELDLILNANTPDTTLQYTSMALERAVVDRVREEPAFFQMLASSEVTPNWLAPGLWPSLRLEERDSGEPAPRVARKGEGSP